MVFVWAVPDPGLFGGVWDDGRVQACQATFEMDCFFQTAKKLADSDLQVHKSDYTHKFLT